MTLNKKANGLDLLVIIIAMMLVAAVAGAVIISTSASLEQNVHGRAAMTQDDLGTSYKILDVYGEDGRDGDFEIFYLTFKLITMTQPLRFNDIIIQMTSENYKHHFSYNASVNCSNTSTLNITAGQYGIHYLKRGKDHLDNYLVKGDSVRVCFFSPDSVEHNKEIEILIIPMFGKVWSTKMITPDYIGEQRIALFP